MGIVDNDPRPHHYRFAHKVLADLARDLGPKMLDSEPEQGFGPALLSLWNGFGERLPAADRLPGGGLRADLITLGRHRLLVVVLPRPAAPAEAYYTAVVQPGGADHCRYLTLELALNPFTGKPYTVLGEWADGSHLNLGPGPAPDLSGFLTAVVDLLAEPAPGPAVAARPGPSAPQGKPERRGLRRLFGR
ncbi:hypothetical protein SAMN05216371_8015 [Streptomyces sp. TLI_053]|uniref:hypothetical protein n=1 Tax=Streptomyces sp. TLI_053 TaxID=1855352 RepID=UPI00087CE570|nr:hypothetical protein [Streptomyces sp. TLI_053]SDT83201.1 hypothetical protein SAMN05216371_8015 [Streptomyces sp. TLI_053]